MTFHQKKNKRLPNRVPSRISSPLAPLGPTYLIESPKNLNLLNDGDWHGKYYLKVLKNFSKKNNFSSVCYHCFNSFPKTDYTCSECKCKYSLCDIHTGICMTLFSGNMCVFCRRHINVEIMHSYLKMGIKPDRYYNLREDFYYDRIVKNIINKLKKKKNN